MAKRKSDDQKTIRRKLNEVVDSSVSSVTDEYVAALNVAFKEGQKNMFKVLAQQIIGSTGPSSEWGSYAESWDALTLKYRRYRYKKKKVAHNRFFRFRSKIPDSGKTSLSELLSRARAETVFGASAVTKRRRKVGSKIQNVIVVQPFPKLTEDLNSSNPDAASYFRGSNRGIAFRLNNFQGKVNRPVLRPFMLWWLNVRSRSIISSVTGAK